MALIGRVREFFEQAKFRVITNKGVGPASVFNMIRFAGETVDVPIPMVPEPDTDGIPDNEYVSADDLETEDQPLGIAVLSYGATDFGMNSAVGSDTIRVVSTYGRNYGEDYGNGI